MSVGFEGLEKDSLSPVSDDETSDTEMENFAFDNTDITRQVSGMPHQPFIDYTTLFSASHETLSTLQLPIPPPINDINKNWALNSLQYGLNNPMSPSSIIPKQYGDSSAFLYQYTVPTECFPNVHILENANSCIAGDSGFAAQPLVPNLFYQNQMPVGLGATSFIQGGDVYATNQSNLQHSNSTPSQPVSSSSYSAATLEWLNGHPDIPMDVVFEGHIDPFPEDKIRQILSSLQITQPAIDEASDFMAQFINPPGPLFQIMAEEYCKNESAIHCLAIFYLFNHLVQNYQNIIQRNQNGESFADIGYKRFIHFVASKIACQQDNRKYMQCVKVWQDRGIYNKSTCEKLRFILSPASNSYSSRVGDLVGANPNISNSLGTLLPITYILEMPSPEKACQNAKKIFPELTNMEAKLDQERFAEMDQSILEKASNRFDRASRLTGQEIILLQSLLLDLGALVEDNHTAILNIKKMFENKISHN